MRQETVILKQPFYIKFVILLGGLIAFFYIIYVTQSILLPFVFAVLVAILLNPVVNWLVLKGMNRIIAILLTMFVSLLLMAGLVTFIVSEFHSFANDLPKMRAAFTQFFSDAVAWLSQKFNLSSARINEWINEQKSSASNGKLIGDAAITISRFFTLLLIIPVFIFLILYYKPLILSFISRLFPKRFHNTVAEVLTEIRTLVNHYLLALLIEMAIVATLTSVGLILLGVPNAILFGIITALMNTIPYVGVAIANVTFAAITLVTKSPTSALMVFCLYVLVQFIDNNIVVPKIVGARVKMNALATLVVILIGGELCGVAGMFLAIPVLAVFKVIFDHVRGLEHLGYLLGDNMPRFDRNFFGVRKKEVASSNVKVDAEQMNREKEKEKEKARDKDPAG